MASILTTIGHGFLFIISTVIFWLIFPFVYVLAIPLYLYRILVKYLARVLHPEWIGIMNLRDVFVSERMEGKKGLSSVVTMATIQRGDPDMDFIRKCFMEKVMLQPCKKSGSEEELLPYTKFTYYYDYWCGFPFWKEEENFSLESHIRVWEETGETETTEEDFVAKMGPLTTRPFAKGMSPWEMLIIPNYIASVTPPDPQFIEDFVGNNNNNNDEKSEKRFVIIFRFHHTLCDGFSMAKLFVQNFGGQPEENTPRAARKKPSVFTLMRYAVQTLLQLGYCHLKILVWDYDFNKWHIPTKELTGDWHTVMTEPLPFNLAREVSKRTGTATTTVLFGAIAGGLRRYWKSMGKTDKEIPKLMRALFPLPVSKHPLDGLVNHWTFANIPLPMGTPDAITRLKKIHNNFDSLRDSPIPALVWLFSPLYMGVPKWLINLWGTNRMTTMTISSFPGPKKPILFFDRWYIEDTMYWLPRLRGNASLYLAILTYKGSIRITLTTDKAVFPLREEAQRLIQCIQDELYSFDLLQTEHVSLELA